MAADIQNCSAESNEIEFLIKSQRSDKLGVRHDDRSKGGYKRVEPPHLSFAQLSSGQKRSDFHNSCGCAVAAAADAGLNYWTTTVGYRWTMPVVRSNIDAPPVQQSSMFPVPLSAPILKAGRHRPHTLETEALPQATRQFSWK